MTFQFSSCTFGNNTAYAFSYNFGSTCTNYLGNGETEYGRGGGVYLSINSGIKNTHASFSDCISILLTTTHLLPRAHAQGVKQSQCLLTPTGGVIIATNCLLTPIRLSTPYRTHYCLLWTLVLMFTKSDQCFRIFLSIYNFMI